MYDFVAIMGLGVGFGMIFVFGWLFMITVTALKARLNGEDVKAAIKPLLDEL